MSEDALVLLCVSPFLVSCGMILLVMIHMWTEDARHALWPRGLRWFPRTYLGAGERLHRRTVKIFWPERTVKTHRLIELEIANDLWNAWAGTDVPVWHPSPDGQWGRWEPRRAENVHVPDYTLPEHLLAKPCPCGYRRECAVHCGSGHADGGCPAHNPEPTAVAKPGTLLER